MDAGAVRQPGVQHRPLVGDLAADPLGHIVDRGQQGVFAGEAGIGANQFAAALDVDTVIAVDHDLADRFIVHERFDRLKKIADAGFKDRLARHSVTSAASGGSNCPYCGLCSNGFILRHFAPNVKLANGQMQADAARQKIAYNHPYEAY